jgi:hypothetical protein
MIIGWTYDQVSKLASGGYLTLKKLQGARREGLREAEILPALVDDIINAQGKATALHHVVKRLIVISNACVS